MEKTKKRFRAFEMKCMMKLLGISYLEHNTNECEWNKVESIVCSKVWPWCTLHAAAHAKLLCRPPSMTFVGEGDHVRAGQTK